LKVDYGTNGNPYMFLNIFLLRKFLIIFVALSHTAEEFRKLL